jgi:hypothetical protein
MTTYGNAPEPIGVFDLPFTEYMHFMYLPIFIGDVSPYFHIPKRLEFASGLIEAAVRSEATRRKEENLPGWTHIYVTARRGFATPGNPLNRPGWHSDGFGTDDINYVWTDRFPTHYAEGDFGIVSDDHIESVRNFDDRITESNIARNRIRETGIVDRSSMPKIVIRTYADNVLQRLDSSVIHAAPEIPAPGGERSFFKVSFSNDRYDLVGNSHNYDLDYDWPMYRRGEQRNDPSKVDGRTTS